MSSRYVRGLWVVAVATVWGVVTIASVNASTMPPPDQPEEAETAVPPVEQEEAVAPPAMPAEAAEQEVAPPPPSDQDVTEGMVDEQTADDASLAPPSQPASGLGLPSDGIRRDVEIVGEVVGHPTGKVLMAAPDMVTLKLNRSVNASPHQRYAIARRAQFVEHPDSGRNMGYVIRVVGTVELQQSFGRYWSGRVVSSTDYVTLDDWVIPFESVAAAAGQAPSDRAGHIVAIQDELELPGESNVVYTDLGSDLGVKPGDEFTVVRPGAGGRRGGPDRSVGVLRILAVQPASSSAYLTKSDEPVMIGDRLEHLVSAPAVQ